MSNVNFVEQFNAIMEYVRENYIHSREAMLWIALFYSANKRAQYDDQTKSYEWPDDFFPVSNSELNSYGQFDKRAIETLRNNLKQKGLIDFIKGEKNKRNPAYKINYLVRVGYKYAPNYVPNNVPNSTPNYVPNSVPNSTPNYASNSVPNSEVLGTNTHPTMSPFNKYNNKNNNYSDSYSANSERYTARERESESRSGLVDLNDGTSGTRGLVDL